MNLPAGLRAPMAVMFLVFTVMLGGVSLGITNNANGIKEAIYTSCLGRADIEAGTNKLLDKMIVNAESSEAFSTEEKRDRIAGWVAMRQTPEKCVRL